MSGVDAIYQNNKAPIIKIGKGSSKYFVNLCKSYLKNYSSIMVISGGQKINLAMWIIYALHDEYSISGLDLQCTYTDKPQTIFMFYVSNGDYRMKIPKFVKDETLWYIKVSKNSSMKSLSRLITKSNRAKILAAGGSCAKACFLAVKSIWMNYYIESIEIITTNDHNNKDQVGILMTINNAEVYINALQ